MSTTKEKEYVFRPFDRIALSLSGGGYRATLFHLGTLSYLNHSKWQNGSLLDNVRIISTVSGGTITGLVYALKTNQGNSFQDVYCFLRERVCAMDLVSEALKKLNPDGKWVNEYKERNLINAFAELYDKHLFEGAMLGDFEEMHGSVKTVVFNSTDFQNGKNFKFRNKEAHQIIGTKDFNIPWDIARTIKLADVLAASSCFPGGFEPILWPHDFRHSGNDEMLEKDAACAPVGLMDGGIYDNQGVSVLLDYKKGLHDLVLLSDVSSPVFDAYQPYDNKGSKSKMSAQKLRRGLKLLPSVLWSLFLICTVSTFVLWFLEWYYSFNSFRSGLWMGVSMTGSVVTGLGLLLFYQVKRRFARFSDGILDRNSGFYKKKLGHLDWKKMGLTQIQKLMMDRFLSVEKLMMDVNLKVIRQLHYNRLYKDENYQYRRMSVIIGGLTEEDWSINNPENLKGHKTTGDSSGKQTYHSFYSETFRNCVQEASDFGTQLWFTDHEFEKGMPDKLIATGQATTCFQLLKYLDVLIHTDKSPFAQLSDNDQTELQKLYAAVANDFDQFRVDPYWMITR